MNHSVCDVCSMLGVHGSYHVYVNLCVCVCVYFARDGIYEEAKYLFLF